VYYPYMALSGLYCNAELMREKTNRNRNQGVRTVFVCARYLLELPESAGYESVIVAYRSREVWRCRADDPSLMAHYSCDNINHLSSLSPLSPSQPPTTPTQCSCRQTIRYTRRYHGRRVTESDSSLTKNKKR
jgi:hypothetical protein